MQRLNSLSYLLLCGLMMLGISSIEAQSVLRLYEALDGSTAKATDVQILKVRDGAQLPTSLAAGASFSLELPSPEGGILEVNLREHSVFTPEMQAKYPEIRTYRGVATKNGNPVIITQTPEGVNVYVRDVHESWMIEPIGGGEARMGLTSILGGEDALMPLNCGFEGHGDADHVELGKGDPVQAFKSGPVVKSSYILALACTGEYAQSVGGTKRAVNGRFAQALNILNGILLGEFAMEFILHPQNDTLIFLDPATDPYTTANIGTSLLGENPIAINSRIPIDSYDLGHVFTIGCQDVGGVVSGLACTNLGKARGVTCNYTNLTVIVERVMAHEIAHQFAVSHSWNNCPSSDPQRASGWAFEPGSGSTIMSYQGSCGQTNNVSTIQTSTYFHVGSLQQFTNYVVNGNGASCADRTTMSNNVPVVEAPGISGKAIPKSTPFLLEGSATDADGDQLLYNWEQYDLGPAYALCDQRNDGPLFRSLPPTPGGNVRYFPNLPTIRANSRNCEELLPDRGRPLTFRLTARDRDPEGAGTAWVQVDLQVAENAGPFEVTSQDRVTTYSVGEFVNITWDVAGTNLPPVSCQAVDILLSMDDGRTFPFVLAEGTLNDGSEGVTIPNVEGNDARIMVRSSDNVFFQLSRSRFGIIAPTEPGFTFIPSESSVFLCLPEIATIDVSTSSLLGYDSTLSLRIVNSLPAGVVAGFEETSLEPGQSTVLTVDFSAFNQTDSVTILIEAVGPGVDTAVREIIFDVVSNDFSDLDLLSPTNGSSGFSGLPTFEFTPSQRATEHLLQVSTDPNFGIGSFEISDPDPNGDQLQFLLEPNTVYFWRVLPSNRCGQDFDVPINAFHTQALSCQTFSNNLPITIPANIRTTVEADIDIRQTGQVNDLNVPLVNVRYPPVNNLRVGLLAPDGTSIDLINRRCTGDRIRTGFDDESPIPYGCDPSIADGQARRPLRPLSTFNGKEINGVWKLQVEVLTSNTSGGAFDAFEIEFCADIVSLPPTLNLNEVPVPMGGFQRLLAQYLDASDPDNDDDDLVFTIVTPPSRGFVLFQGDTLSSGGRFSMRWARWGDVEYHDVLNTPGTDSMTIVLSDNAGNIIATPTVRFNISPDNVLSDNVPVSKQVAMSLAPNPSNGWTRVRWNDAAEGGHLQVIDASGRVLMIQEVFPGQTEAMLEISHLPSGMYQVHYRGLEGVRTLRLMQQQ